MTTRESYEIRKKVKVALKEEFVSDKRYGSLTPGRH